MGVFPRLMENQMDKNKENDVEQLRDVVFCKDDMRCSPNSLKGVV